jgi:hypothetical protein
MVSRSLSHSVLSINLSNSYNYSVDRSIYGNKYVVWELIIPNWRLAYEVEDNNWNAELE